MKGHNHQVTPSLNMGKLKSRNSIKTLFVEKDPVHR